MNRKEVQPNAPLVGLILFVIAIGMLAYMLVNHEYKDVGVTKASFNRSFRQGQVKSIAELEKLSGVKVKYIEIKVLQFPGERSRENPMVFFVYPDDQVFVVTESGAYYQIWTEGRQGWLWKGFINVK